MMSENFSEGRMAGLAELEQRVSALEEAQRRDRVVHNADMASVKRDLRTLIENQDHVLAQLDDLTRRVVANELVATANARTTEMGFANLLARIERLEAGQSEQFTGQSELRAGLDQLSAGQDQMRAEQVMFRAELPGMIAETMREVLREARGAS
jgi:hypothetical protein